MVPTVLDCLGIEPPAVIKGVTQSPIEGVSFAHTLDNASAPTRHHTQYFEMMGHRSLYHDGWRAVCPWPGPSFAESGKFFGAPITADVLTGLDAKGWELYHVEKDWAENNDLATDNRSKLIEMIATWYAEAGKYHVLPIDSRGTLRFADERPQIAADRTSYTYYPGTQPIPANSAVRVLNRPHSITADVDIPAGGAEGALLSHGDIEAGYIFYVKGGKLHWTHNYVNKTFYHVESVEKIPEGRHQLRFEFEVTGKPDIANGKGAPGKAQLYIDGKLVGQAEVPVTTPLSLGLTGLSCGAAHGAPVVPEYQPPFEFTGKIYGVTVDVSGELIEDKEAEVRMIMARQ
jgi:arylsulfatase